MFNHNESAARPKIKHNISVLGSDLIRYDNIYTTSDIHNISHVNGARKTNKSKPISHLRMPDRYVRCCRPTDYTNLKMS